MLTAAAINKYKMLNRFYYRVLKKINKMQLIIIKHLKEGRK
jgi:hypothetical protein